MFSLQNFGILCKGYYLKTEFNVGSKSMFEPESLTFFSHLYDQHERLFCAIKKLSSRHLRLSLLIIHVSSNFKWLVSCEIYETLTNAKHNVPNHEIFPKQNDDMDSKRATVQLRDKVGKKEKYSWDTVTQTVLQTMSSRQIPLKFTSNYSLVPSTDSIACSATEFGFSTVGWW